MGNPISLKRFLITEIILLGVSFLGWQLATEKLVIKFLGYTQGSCVGTPCFADAFPQSYSIYLGMFLVGGGLLIAVIYFFIALLRYVRHLTKRDSEAEQVF